MRFSGKTVIVTGGAQGIGRACALAFAAEGGAVVIADIAVDAGEALADEIGQARRQGAVRAHRRRRRARGRAP